MVSALVLEHCVVEMAEELGGGIIEDLEGSVTVEVTSTLTLEEFNAISVEEMSVTNAEVGRLGDVEVVDAATRETESIESELKRSPMLVQKVFKLVIAS